MNIRDQREDLTLSRTQERKSLLEIPTRHTTNIHRVLLTTMCNIQIDMAKGFILFFYLFPFLFIIIPSERKYRFSRRRAAPMLVSVIACLLPLHTVP